MLSDLLLLSHGDKCALPLDKLVIRDGDAPYRGREVATENPIVMIIAPSLLLSGSEIGILFWAVDRCHFLSVGAGGADEAQQFTVVLET